MVYVRTSRGRTRHGQLGQGAELTSGGVLFRGTRDCFVRTIEAALIVRELRRTSFEPGDSASAAADAIDEGLSTGEVGPLSPEEAAAVQAVLLRLATMRPDLESLTTLHATFALDQGEL